jgi:hypothetical protein
MTAELTFSANLADELKPLRGSGEPVVIDARDRGTPERTSPQLVSEGAPRSLAALDRHPSPTVLAITGPLDAAALALCCACTIAYVDRAATLAELDPATALHLNLAGRLTERLGPSAAAQILLGAAIPCQPVEVGSPQGDQSLRVAIATADPLAAARATAARLAEPGGALLARSLAFAARSTPGQSAAYDEELLALLPDQERPR